LYCESFIHKFASISISEGGFRMNGSSVKEVVYINVFLGF